MRTRNLSLTLLLLPLLLLGQRTAYARIGQMTVKLRATRPALLADGKHTEDIIAEVRDSSGLPPQNIVTVTFQTSSGTLSESRVQAVGGIARTRLTSSPIAGVARVQAFVPGGLGASDYIEVVFTDDPEATFSGNNYMLVTGKSYLSYSATDKVIEAQGKEAGARLTFRNLELTADRLQLRAEDGVVRAHNNVTLKRGNVVIHATRLFYSLNTGQGFGLAELNGKLQVVNIIGERLRLEPSATPIPSSYMMFPELQVKLVIVANSITYFPNDKLQFRHPKFYQDQVQILSLPYYELGLNSQELFSDHFVSLGTSGFGLEIPFYLSLSPRQSNILYVRHQQPLGRGYYATTPGWALDLVQGYSSQGDRKYEGALGFTGLTRSDWSFRWSHSQEINSATQGSFYLDFPHHNSVFSSMNLTQQFKRFRWGANISAGQTFAGTKERTFQNDVYTETQAHRLLGMKGLMYTLGTNVQNTSLRSSSGQIGSFNETSEEVNMRAFSRPVNLDKRTTLSNSFSVGHLWSSNGKSGLSALATLALDHTIPGGGSLNISYDFVTRPASQLVSPGNHRVSLSYGFSAGKRFEATLFGSAYLDQPDASLLADFSYRLDKNWRLMAGATLQQFAGESYRDIEFTVGHRLGARELQLTYSMLLRRLSLDFTATRF